VRELETLGWKGSFVNCVEAVGMREFMNEKSGRKERRKQGTLKS
jgi:hypothetical protein